MCTQMHISDIANTYMLQGNVNALKCLFESGADLNKADEDDTPADMAAKGVRVRIDYL